MFHWVGYQLTSAIPVENNVLQIAIFTVGQCESQR